MHAEKSHYAGRTIAMLSCNSMIANFKKEAILGESNKGQIVECAQIGKNSVHLYLWIESMG